MMTQRSGTERRQRTRQVGVRLTPEEWQRLEQLAASFDMSLPQFLRRSWGLGYSKGWRDHQDGRWLP